jgi:signal transduction histidine kinase
MVGVFTSRQVRRQFQDAIHQQTTQLQHEISINMRAGVGQPNCDAPVGLRDFASAERAQIRIFSGGELLCAHLKIKGTATPPPNPAFPPPTHTGTYTQFGYYVEARALGAVPGAADLTLLYARPLAEVDETLAKVRFFLLLGVLGGTVLALLAGLSTAQRAMRPIVALTAAAREIERTRDASRRLPHPEAHDEVAELAVTLEDMLGALDDARTGTEAMLERQREFVADASHELRTPLTSVLANLELLAEELRGEQADSAQAALRATRRMRRLVGDLLLLARADAHRTPRQRRPTDLAEVVTEAASELGPIAERHELSLHVEPAVISGVRDDLHRMVLNLLENAVQHTAPGSHVAARTESADGTVTLTVQDDGPGIDPALGERVFERFVRSGGDGGRGSGLGLAIVRAVVESHGGTVTLDLPAEGGTRFTIRLPAERAPEPAPAAPAQISTTTGNTMGRRRNRS